MVLLSDAGHNLSDVFGLLIAWGAIYLGKSLPTQRRTYGLRRASILASLTNAIMGLLRESINLAMDAVPSRIKPQAVEKFLTELPGVRTVHDLHIWAMSTTETALTVHLVMPELPCDDKFLHETSHELEHRFAIGHVTIQLEHGNADCVCHQEPAHVV
ncbi:MAG: cation transporter [Verrucomicrobiota bacterium]